MNELIVELQQLVDGPAEFKYAQICLSHEISRVWNEYQKSSLSSSTSPSPPTKRRLNFGNLSVSEMSSCSPSLEHPSYSLPTSFTPLKPVKGDSRIAVTPMRNDEEWMINDSKDPVVILQTKVYIPDPPAAVNGRPVKCSYIGRILGPSGMSAKMLERQFDVTLLIRGRGSVRDSKREQELIGKKGFEHLDEPLHVLLIAKHQDKQKCEDTLEKAAQKVESLLTPVHDDLKKDQLLRLAVMNGTYVQRSPRSMMAGISSSPDSIYYA